MLILTRRVGEDIIIGEDPTPPEKRIEVTVLGIKGGQVRLGIEAPHEISIYRREIQERIDREKNNYER